jgi:hypothetical protein
MAKPPKIPKPSPSPLRSSSTAGAPPPTTQPAKIPKPSSSPLRSSSSTGPPQPTQGERPPPPPPLRSGVFSPSICVLSFLARPCFTANFVRIVVCSWRFSPVSSPISTAALHHCCLYFAIKEPPHRKPTFVFCWGCLSLFPFVFLPVLHAL